MIHRLLLALGLDRFACRVFGPLFGSGDEKKSTRAPQAIRGTRAIENTKGERIVTKLKNISEIRRYFHRNETPIYFISATNFNLLGLSEWVRKFRYINYIDCYDGRHPNVFVPSEIPHREFESIEDINNYMLEHKEVLDYIEERGPGGKALFLMFDEKTEELAREAGLEVWFPPAKLRSRVDNKVETVRIGNRAGVPSVPNVLSKVESYEHLRQVSGELGDHLVLQAAFGDSGHTTWFI